MYPFERFSPGAKRVLTLAQQEAERARHPYIGTEHILVALLVEGNGIAAQVLTGIGIDEATVRATVDELLGAGAEMVVQQVIPTSRVKKVIELAFEQARAMGDATVDTEHLLLGVLMEGEGVAARVLALKGAPLSVVQVAVARHRGMRELHTVTDDAPVTPPDVNLAMQLLHEASRLAHTRSETFGTEHVLLALARSDAGRARAILHDHGLTPEAIEGLLG